MKNPKYFYREFIETRSEVKNFKYISMKLQLKVLTSFKILDLLKQIDLKVQLIKLK